MKHAKKFASLLLALVLVFSLTVTAFADETNGTITIDNAVVGQIYSIYQILDLESYNKDNNAYSYKATSDWNEFINSAAIKGVYVNVNDEGYVTWLTTKNDKGEDVPADAAAFAKLAQKYAKDNSIAPSKDAVTATDTTVEFTGLDLGYYLLDSTLGTLCSLDTTNPNVTIREKNEVPTNVKTVEEDSTGVYGPKNDADIGQTVNFKSTVTIPDGSENLVFHDTMTAGLTLNKTEGAIKVYTDEDMTTELAADNYTVTTAELTDECTFEVTFVPAYLDSLTETATVYVKYSATVNENAVIGGAGNPNTSKLSYGDSTNTKFTPPSTTITYTWEFDVLKYANGDESKVLADAQFVLLNEDKNQVATIVNGKLTGWADLPTATEGAEVTWPANTVLTTDANGKIEIDGLDADTYYLREVKAPAGYNKLPADTEVVIAPTASEDGKTLTLAPVVAKVNNQSGTELPETGGMGTTIFYMVGSILLIGAVVLLITKKRMSTTR